MLVILKFPYVLKRSAREEMVDKYTNLLRSGDAVFVVDASMEVEVYKTDEDDIDVKIEYRNNDEEVNKNDEKENMARV